MPLPLSSLILSLSKLALSVGLFSRNALVIDSNGYKEKTYRFLACCTGLNISETLAYGYSVPHSLVARILPALCWC